MKMGEGICTLSFLVLVLNDLSSPERNLEQLVELLLVQLDDTRRGRGGGAASDVLPQPQGARHTLGRNRSVGARVHRAWGRLTGMGKLRPERERTVFSRRGRT